MENFENYDYLLKNDIKKLEDLVGRKVYVVFPLQGIKDFTIRKIEYTQKSHTWFIVINASERLTRLGNGIFFTEDEARKWQLLKLDEYSQKQQEKILRREQEIREKELKELERLLLKYPDEERRS